MDYLLYIPYYIIGSANYRVQNKYNLFNFIIGILEMVNENEKIKIIELLKRHLGITVYIEFQQYIRKKYEVTHSLNILTP